MTLIEKIEKALTYTVQDNKGDLFIYDNVLTETFSNDSDFEQIKESVNAICDFFNKAENKEEVSNMEIEDILKSIK